MDVEKGLRKRDFSHILGSDESGRGCVAGPVIAATCCILQDLETYVPIEGVQDSKKLRPEDRQRIYDTIVSQPEVYAWAVAERSHADIDESNILLATMECFKDSIETVASTLGEDDAPYSIVDGKKAPKLSIKLPSRPWVKGDNEVYTVALASIIAKVTRDQMALQWQKDYPEYGFGVHKGYATAGHVEAIHKHGPCPIHRMSFKTLKGR